MKTDCYKPYYGKELGVLYYFDLRPQAFVEQPKGYKLTTIGKQVFMRSGNQFGFLLAMDPSKNFNNHPQVGKLYFKHDPKVTDEIFVKSRHGDVYMPTEDLRTIWHSRNSDSARKTVVSHSAVRLFVQCYRQYKESEVIQILTDNGFTISSNDIRVVL